MDKDTLLLIFVTISLLIVAVWAISKSDWGRKL